MQKNILLFFLLFNSAANAQSYIPTIVNGRTWEINKPMGMGQYVTFFIKTVCDTQINSLNYLKVMHSWDHGYFVREDTITHQVFDYDNVSGVEHLLIDYDISVGATFNGMLVDSINYATYYNQLRKVIYFHGASPLVKWIEGIGCNFNGITPTFYGWTNVDSVFDGDSNCYPLHIAEIEFNNFEINQTASIIYIANLLKTNYVLKIYNTAGQMVEQVSSKNNVTLDLSMFPSQLFIMEIICEKRRIIRKVVIN